MSGNGCMSPAVHTHIWNHMCTHTHTHTDAWTAKYTAWGLSFRYCAHWSDDFESQGALLLLFLLLLSPRGSLCYARGSERFTFNFHFSYFELRFTCNPEVFFPFFCLFTSFLLFQLSWNHNEMYSAWGAAQFTMQFDTKRPFSLLFWKCTCANGLLTSLAHDWNYLWSTDNLFFNVLLQKYR